MGPRRPRLRVWSHILILALLLLCGAGIARADDRDLVRESSDDPYVFILLDVSGSMNESVPCSAADLAAGLCSYHCPPGGCLPRLASDDPASKIYVAKEAIYEIMQEVDDIHFGFATFDQDAMRALRKHWWYQVAPRQASGFIDLDSGASFPPAGQEDVFGETWGCTDAQGPSGPNNALRYIGCRAEDPADLDDAWEYERVRRWPKLDDDNDTDRTFYIRDPADAAIYQVTYRDVAAQTLGNPTVNVDVEVRRCGDASCSKSSQTGRKTLTFVKVDEMVQWEPSSGVIRQPLDCTNGNTPEPCPDSAVRAFFGSIAGPNGPRMVQTSGNDAAWDSNSSSDNLSDPYNGYNLRHPNIGDPTCAADPLCTSRPEEFDIGDVIPLDWLDRQARRIAFKMAPNLLADVNADPDFGVSRYFRDHPESQLGTDILKRKTVFDDVDARPLIPFGGTPTGKSMQSFRNWLSDWKTTASGAGGDPTFGCRKIFLLVLTDGLASSSDGSTACTEATTLRTDERVRSFAIAFGLSETQFTGYSNTLTCIADNGGTGSVDQDGDGEPDGPGPLFPQNKDQLIDSLKQIFNIIRGEPRAFASAAVPQGQAAVADKIFLANFLPSSASPIWPGRLDAYLRPVPTVAVDITLPNGTVVSRQLPDRSVVCGADDESACRLWDAGEELFDQAADASEMAAGTFNLGLGEDERRVYYSGDDGDNVPRARLDFQVPTTTPEWETLTSALGLCPPGDTACASDLGNQREARETQEFMHRIKTIPDPADPTKDLDFLLGDTAHSDPVVVGNPDNFRYWLSDLNGSGSLPLQDPCLTSPDGYRCYLAKHQIRRKVLIAGANDGQLHAYDAGTFNGSCVTGPGGVDVVRGEFDNGTGREIFSYVPSMVLPGLLEQKDTTSHEYSVDARVAVGDVLIDPLHDGTPTPDDREWRTVIAGGLREGGHGYYGLDITQPDDLTVCGSQPILPQPRSGVDSYVPSCNAATDCGPLEYPAVLWEFTDSENCSIALPDGRCDDDGNGLPDLADGWSTPVIGRIKVTVDQGGSDVEVEKYVAIFGGGIDPENKSASDSAGNHLFILDVETGQPIYKRPLDGAAPSDPAAVDTDEDGFLDTIYIGTTRGFMYKVDIRKPAALEDVSLIGKRVLDPAWDPFKVFTTAGRPIYYRPAVVLIAEQGRFALAFGTGDRENLWQLTNQSGRFYMILDTGWQLGDAGLPRAEGAYTRVDVGSGVTADDLLRQGAEGWYIPLTVEERAITRAFSIAGVTVFTSFQPREVVSAGAICRRFGDSRAFILNTTNANGFLAGNNRFFSVEGGFLSSPFVEAGSTKNPVSGDGGYTPPEVPQNMRALTDELKKLLPTNCRFANYTLNLSAVRDDTGIELLAPIPVCTVEKNWKDL